MLNMVLRVGMIFITALLLVMNTNVTEMFVGVCVVDEQFSVLAITAGLFAGNFDHRPDRLCLAENGIHLFQRTVGRFRIEEVDNGEDERVTMASQLVKHHIWRRDAGKTYITAKMIYVW